MSTRVEQATDCSQQSADASGGRLDLLSCVTLAACYILIWFFRRTYSALDDDAHLYALQAMTRSHPNLGADLFLAYGSQDQYTIFSPLYAWFIELIGLTAAESLLTVLFHAWSLCAAWYLISRLHSRALAWLAVGLVILVPGNYGAQGVFEYGETFLTARLPAEALILTALALHASQRRALSYAATVAAFAMHPIIAMPGVALIAWLAFPARVRPYLVAAVVAVLIALPIAAATNALPQSLLMDAAWLDIVRSRCFFLFAQNWGAEDWDWALLTLLTLAFAAAVETRAAVRALIVGAGLIGLCGLLLTIFSSLVPMTIVLQGQPWRWMWIATYVAVLTAAPTFAVCWHRSSTVRYSCVLLYAAWGFPMAWAFPGLIGAPLAAIALCAYASRISSAHAKYVRWLGIGVAGLLCCSVALNAMQLLMLEFSTNRENIAFERARDLLALGVPGIALVVALWFAVIRHKAQSFTLACAGLALVALVFVAPNAYSRWTSSLYASAQDEYGPWREYVDQERNILWPRNPVAVWFVLNSPSYLSVSQSAGVVFSRETALEIRRRAIHLSALAGSARLAIDRKSNDALLPLTVEVLKDICKDPQLGYVVSSSDLAIPRLEAPRGRWSGMHLYSCDALATAPRSERSTPRALNGNES